MKVTRKQFEEMCHALGVRDTYKKSVEEISKKIKVKPYRNYFYTYADNESWNDLVNKGLATSLPGQSESQLLYFIVKDETIKMLRKNEIEVMEGTE